MGGGLRDWLLAKGMTVVRLHHRTPRPKKVEKHVTAWQDAQRAVRLVRAGAAAHGVSPDKIGFIGYSAAGHLALLMALSSQTRAYEPIDEIDALPCNIAFSVPVYPSYVLSDGANGKNAHGGDCAEDVILPEFKFDSGTCPVFFLHGDADGYSPMASIKVYSRLHAMHVSCELHVFALRDHDFKSKGATKGKFLGWRPLLWDWLVQTGLCSDVGATIAR
jgi:acetyl esterase/lipase